MLTRLSSLKDKTIYTITNIFSFVKNEAQEVVKKNEISLKPKIVGSAVEQATSGFVLPFKKSSFSFIHQAFDIQQTIKMTVKENVQYMMSPALFLFAINQTTHFLSSDDEQENAQMVCTFYMVNFFFWHIYYNRQKLRSTLDNILLNSLMNDAATGEIDKLFEISEKLQIELAQFKDSNTNLMRRAEAAKAAADKYLLKKNCMHFTPCSCGKISFAKGVLAKPIYFIFNAATVQVLLIPPKLISLLFGVDIIERWLSRLLTAYLMGHALAEYCGAKKCSRHTYEMLGSNNSFILGLGLAFVLISEIVITLLSAMGFRGVWIESAVAAVTFQCMIPAIINEGFPQQGEDGDKKSVKHYDFFYWTRLIAVKVLKQIKIMIQKGDQREDIKAIISRIRSTWFYQELRNIFLDPDLSSLDRLVNRKVVDNFFNPRVDTLKDVVFYLNLIRESTIANSMSKTGEFTKAAIDSIPQGMLYMSNYLALQNLMPDHARVMVNSIKSKYSMLQIIMSEQARVLVDIIQAILDAYNKQIGAKQAVVYDKTTLSQIELHSHEDSEQVTTIRRDSIYSRLGPIVFITALNEIFFKKNIMPDSKADDESIDEQDLQALLNDWEIISKEGAAKFNSKSVAKNNLAKMSVLNPPKAARKQEATLSATKITPQMVLRKRKLG